jgi:hypothetical protein
VRSLAAPLFALTLLVGACSDGTPGTDTTLATTTQGDTTPGTAATTTTTGPSRASQWGLETIELLTPTEGGGRRPILEWQPVAGAEAYNVVVLAPSGRVYWGWRTVETSVPVGGHPRLNESAAGPAISAGMTWSVTAVASDGSLIALSDQRPISP